MEKFMCSVNYSLLFTSFSASVDQHRNATILKNKIINYVTLGMLNTQRDASASLSFLPLPGSSWQTCSVPLVPAEPKPCARLLDITQGFRATSPKVPKGVFQSHNQSSPLKDTETKI